MIKNMYIIHESGKCLFEFDPHGINDQKQQITASYLAGLAQIAQELFEESIENINFQEKQLIFEHYQSLLLVCVTAKNEDLSRKNHYLLQEILREFYQQYMAELKFNYTSIQTFTPFHETINEALQGISILEESS